MLENETTNTDNMRKGRMYQIPYVQCGNFKNKVCKEFKFI